MGSLTLPASGWVYVDANPVIYTVEPHPKYHRVLLPMWKAVHSGQISVVSSELTLLETLTAPIKFGDATLEAQYEQIWQGAGRQLLPITNEILREAARLRAIFGLKTPDAIHAATALWHGCALFVTNDTGFRRVPNLPLAILDDILNNP